MSENIPEEFFDPVAMERFGLDPKNENDQLEWIYTEPPRDLPAYDYSDDIAVYGSAPPSESNEK